MDVVPPGFRPGNGAEKPIDTDSYLAYILLAFNRRHNTHPGRQMH